MAKKNQQSEAYDKDTGVVSKYQDTGWKKLFMDKLHLLLKIGGGEKSMRIFIYMIREMNNKNVLSRKQSQIAYELDLTRSYVSRVLTKFEQGNICVNGRGWYIVNPDLIFFGNQDREKQHNIYHKKRFNKGLIYADPELEKD